MKSFLEKHDINRLKIITFVFVVGFLLSISFLTHSIMSSISIDNSQDIINIKENEEKEVYNSSVNLQKEIDIVLMNNSEVIKEQSLESFKNENNIVANVNEDFLTTYFEVHGYDLVDSKEDKMVFNKEENLSKLQPNKYYLGEKDGFFAIYKTDDNGKEFIESQDDVYTGKKLDILPPQDQEEIKTFKYGYDTKEEAKEMLSVYIS